jgi:colanic acid/amylovoran biosynthesis glycosyltransferase
MRKAKPVVAHINAGFVYKSETFIYHYLSHLKRFHPLCLASEFVNNELFPLSSRDCYTLPVQAPQKFSYPWLYGAIQRKLFGKNISQEEVIFRCRNVRLIHAHFGPQGFFALKLRGAYKIPVITNFYGFDVSELIRQPQWVENYKTLFREGDLFLVEGLFMKAALAQLGCPEKNIAIQRIAIPLDKIAYVARRPKAQGEKTVLIFTGRFVEKKGVLYALEAVRILKDRYTNFELRIIGDGPLKLEIEKFINDHALQDYVKLLGFLNYDEYLEEARRADIFVQPSVTAENGDSEGGAPTVILEAQAAGMPVIATNHADIPNIVVPGQSALLSGERDVQGLAQNIAHLLDHPQEWESMGKKGRAFVEKFHDIKNETNELEEKYFSLLAQ